MPFQRFLLVSLVPASFLMALAAQSTAPTNVLPWKPISLDAKAMPLARALDSLRRQSGVAITDDLGEPRTIAQLKLDRVSLWQAADEIARAVKARLVQSPRDGSLQLVRAQATDRLPPTAYDGNFRVRLVRVTASRDLESDRTQCVCSLDLAWLAPVRPLFVEGKIVQPKILDIRGKPVEIVDGGSGLTDVDGRFSYTLDLALAGFPRAVATIKLVQGEFLVVAPSRFLTYRFEGNLPTLEKAVVGGALRRLTQADVVCKIDRLILGRERWTVQMGLAYPAGGKTLESFQAGSLVVQNELRLVSADGKRELVPSSYVIDSVSSRRAQVSYHFTDRPGARRGQSADFTIRYQAPERLLDVPVRFSFANVPLP